MPGTAQKEEGKKGTELQESREVELIFSLATLLSELFSVEVYGNEGVVPSIDFKKLIRS